MANTNKLLVLGVAGALAVAAGVGAWVLTPTGPADGGTTAADGAVRVGGDFTLVNHQGETVTQADFAGDYMLAYFGFTYCPDVCPLSLQAMMAGYDALPAEVRSRVRPVFFTVDPERDTVEAMADYVSLFGDDLIGLTGSLEQTDAAASAFRVYHAKNEQTGSAAGYLVDHSSYTYLMGPDGTYVTHFNHGDTPDVIAEGVTQAVRGTS